MASKREDGTLNTAQPDPRTRRASGTVAKGPGPVAPEAAGDGPRSADPAAARPSANGHRVAGVVHDVNNLVMSVLAHAELALEACAPQSHARDHLARVKASARGVAAVLTRLHGPGLATVEPSPERVAVDTAIWEVVEILDPLLGETDVHLLLGANDAPVRCPRGSMETILVNLVLNARDAMRKEGRLTIETRRLPPSPQAPRADSPPETRWIRIVVSDTGPGMDEGTLRSAFDPFFTTKGQRGRGLGLTTVREAVEELGGQVGVRTASGQGATFVIDLPEAPERTATGAFDEGRARKDRTRASILIIEADPVSRDALGELLGQMGYEVHVVAERDQARDLETRRAPDVVVVDAGLASSEDEPLLRQLRRRWPRIAALYVVGPGDTEQARARPGSNEPCVDWIEKPIPLGEMYRKIEQLEGCCS